MKKDFKRFLVVSPNKELWDESKPMLFLGEWCNLFKDLNYNKDLDIKIHPHHWEDKKKQEYDYEYLESLYETKLSDLNISLSKLHGLKPDLRFWRIVIGPWLKFFMDAIYDRYETIRLANIANNIEGTFIYDFQFDDNIPNDFYEFYDHLRNDDWNELIFFEIIKEFNIPFKKIGIKKKTILKNEIKLFSFFKNSLKKFLFFFNNIFSNYFNDVVLFEMYTPLSKLINLQINLGQVPYIGHKNILSSNRKSDNNFRKKIFFSKTNDPFSKFINNQIINFIPRVYIENFNEIKKRVLNKYPRNPKLIVTANAYQGSDSFKIWAAHYTQLNIPLIIHQHGGTFGISKYNQTETHQLKISDNFISWGWNKENYDNIKTLPSLKINPKKIDYDKKNGDILLTLASTPRYFYNFFGVPNGPEFLDYIENQKLFIKNLNSNVYSKLKIRQDSTEFGWRISERISELIDDSKFDLKNTNFRNRLKKCKICISTYNATIFLETLAMNIPTIVFFDIKKYKIRKEAKKYFDLLERVGVFHINPKSAANFLNKIEPNIEEWWQSENVQNIVTDFCLTYAYNSSDWKQKWINFFKPKSL